MREPGPKATSWAKGRRLSGKRQHYVGNRQESGGNVIMIAFRHLSLFGSRRFFGITRRAAQMQVCIPDPAELFPHRGRQCARAAADGQSPGRQGRLRMVGHHHGWPGRRRQQRPQSLADRGARQTRSGRHLVRLRRHQCPRSRIARAIDGAAAAGRSPRGLGRALHRRLCTGAGGSAG